MVDMGQPVRRTFSVWVYGQKINNENGVKPKMGTTVLHNNNPDMKWKTNPSGYKRTTRGDAPVRPADPLKYKYVSKYNLKFDWIWLQKLRYLFVNWKYG